MKKVLMSLMLTLLIVGGGVEQHSEEGTEKEIFYSASTTSTSYDTLGDDLIKGEH